MIERPAEPRRLRFPGRHRVKKRKEFLQIRGAGHSVRDQNMRVGWRERGDESPARLGLAVTRRMGNSVARNRIKRVLREAWRLQPGLFPRGVDIVVIPLARERCKLYEEVRRSLSRLSRRMAGKD